MSQIILDLPVKMKEQVELYSRNIKKTPEAFITEALAQYLEDLEDYEDAMRIKAEVDAGRMETYTLEEVRLHLGMVD